MKSFWMSMSISAVCLCSLLENWMVMSTYQPDIYVCLEY